MPILKTILITGLIYINNIRNAMIYQKAYKKHSFIMNL